MTLRAEELKHKERFLYLSTISLLEQIKLTRSPYAVSGTLKKHKKLANFLDNYQKSTILELESKLDD